MPARDKWLRRVANNTAKRAFSKGNRYAIDPVTIITIISIITRIILYFLERYNNDKFAVVDALDKRRIKLRDKLLLRYFLIRKMGFFKGSRVYSSLTKEMLSLSPRQRLFLIAEVIENEQG